MTNPEQWNEFLDSLISNAMQTHHLSRECEYLKQRQAQIDEMLTTHFDDDQKIFVEEILFEFGLAAERETEIVYRQGLKDCVWLLKNLNVLS